MTNSANRLSPEGSTTPSFQPAQASGSIRLAMAALFLGAIAIAFSPIFVRLSELGPTTTAFYRVLFAVPALMAWGAMAGTPDHSGTQSSPSTLADYSLLALAGAFFAGDLAFWHWSIQFTSVANSTLLANFAPIFVTLAGFLLFKERFSRKFLLGLAVGISGAIVVLGNSFSIGGDTLLGDGLALITALFYAAYLITIGRLRTRFSTLTIMVWSSATTALILLPVALLSNENLIAETAYGWFILLGLALVSHAGGQSLIAYALAHLPVAFSSISLLIQPVAASFFAWLILSEALEPLQALGAIIVLSGIFLARKGSR